MSNEVVKAKRRIAPDVIQTVVADVQTHKFGFRPLKSSIIHYWENFEGLPLDQGEEIDDEKEPSDDWQIKFTKDQKDEGILVPSDVYEVFTKIATPFTRQSCQCFGYLYGIENRVTHLYVPQQTIEGFDSRLAFMEEASAEYDWFESMKDQVTYKMGMITTVVHPSQKENPAEIASFFTAKRALIMLQVDLLDPTRIRYRNWRLHPDGLFALNHLDLLPLDEAWSRDDDGRRVAMILPRIGLTEKLIRCDTDVPIEMTITSNEVKYFMYTEKMPLHGTDRMVITTGRPETRSVMRNDTVLTPDPSRKSRTVTIAGKDYTYHELRFVNYIKRNPEDPEHHEYRFNDTPLLINANLQFNNESIKVHESTAPKPDDFTVTLPDDFGITRGPKPLFRDSRNTEKLILTLNETNDAGQPNIPVGVYHFMIRVKAIPWPTEDMLKSFAKGAHAAYIDAALSITTANPEEKKKALDEIKKSRMVFLFDCGLSEYVCYRLHQSYLDRIIAMKGEMPPMNEYKMQNGTTIYTTFDDQPILTAVEVLHLDGSPYPLPSLPLTAEPTVALTAAWRKVCIPLSIQSLPPTDKPQLEDTSKHWRSRLDGTGIYQFLSRFEPLASCAMTYPGSPDLQGIGDFTRRVLEGDFTELTPGQDCIVLFKKCIEFIKDSGRMNNDIVKAWANDPPEIIDLTKFAPGRMDVIMNLQWKWPILKDDGISIKDRTPKELLIVHERGTTFNDLFPYRWFQKDVYSFKRRSEYTRLSDVYELQKLLIDEHLLEPVAGGFHLYTAQGTRLPIDQLSYESRSKIVSVSHWKKTSWLCLK